MCVSINGEAWRYNRSSLSSEVGAPHFTIRTPKDVVHMRVVQSTGAREVAKGVLMAENVRSPFDYREPPTLDSDGDGSKPPPPRGWVSTPAPGFAAARGCFRRDCEQNARARDARAAASVRVCLVNVGSLYSRAWFHRNVAENRAAGRCFR